jgi:predicted membrane protein
MPDTGCAGVSLPSRSLSLVLAVGVSSTLLFFPYLLGSPPSPRVHALLPVLFFGVSGAWVHGLGFVPRRRVWRILFGPIVAWPAVAISGLLIAWSRIAAGT